VQQAILQVLSVRYVRIFSTHSYGFRPNKNAHQALKQAGEYVVKGKGYVIDLDLEKFFDEVNHPASGGTVKYTDRRQESA
jgi:RNA-directed DNA polymerase